MTNFLSLVSRVVLLMAIIKVMSAYAYSGSFEKLNEVAPGDESWVEEVFPGNSSLSINWLRHLIELNHVESIEELLPLLPEGLRKSFTLVKKSGALQGADAKNPRAILFAPDGRLILTFNGESYQERFQHLEILDYTARDGRARFFEIDFNKSGEDRFSQENPVTCTKCHSSFPRPQGEVRPIWFNYSRWFGSYGEQGDRVSVQELEAFEKFIEHSKKHPRYKWLIRDSEKSTYAPYHRSARPFDSRSSDNDPARYLDHGVSVKLRSAMFMPGLRLSKALDARNAKRLAQRITSHTLFKQFPYSTLFNLLCTHKGIKVSRSNDSSLLPEGIPRLSLSDFGLTENDFTLLFSDYAADYHNGNHTTNTKAMVTDLVARTVLDSNSPLAKLYRPSFWRAYYARRGEVKDPNYVYTDTYKYLWVWSYLLDEVAHGLLTASYSLVSPLELGVPEGFPGETKDYACLELGKAAKTEYVGQERAFPQFSEERKPFYNSFYGNTLMTSRPERSVQTLLKECASCHEPKEISVDFAPYIPFASQGLLQIFLKSGETREGHNQFIDRVKAVTGTSRSPAHLGGARMPLGRQPLTDSETRAFVNYLESLL